METSDPGDPPLPERRGPVVPADALVWRWRADALVRWARRRLHRARRWLRRGLLALIYTPAIGMLLAGMAAAVGLLGGLWRLARALTTQALDTVPTTYDRLALTGHVALISGTFWGLICALVVVAIGCRGRRWWRLYLIPAAPLSAAAALLLIVAVQVLAQGINQRLGWPPSVWNALTALTLIDAVLVAAHAGGIGAGPLGTRRARLRGRLRGSRTTEATSAHPRSRQTRPIPVVRFGPRDTGVPLPDSATVPSAPLNITDAPTAEDLRTATGSAPIVGEVHERAG